MSAREWIEPTFPVPDLECHECGADALEPITHGEALVLRPLIDALRDHGLTSAKGAANEPGLLIELDHVDARRLTEILKEPSQ